MTHFFLRPIVNIYYILHVSLLTILLWSSLVVNGLDVKPRSLISNVVFPAHTPDPAVTFYEGFYYSVRSKIEGSPTNMDLPGWNCWHAAQDQIIITKSRSLQVVFSNPEATSVIVNRKSPMGDTSGGVSVGRYEITYTPGITGCPLSSGFWAPSLKHIDGSFFIFVTGHRPDVPGESNFVLECTGDDPMHAGSWEYRGMLDHELPGLDGEPVIISSVLDPLAETVTLKDNGKTITGKLYYVYSHNNKRMYGNQELHLVRLIGDNSSFTEYDSDLGRNMTYTRKWKSSGEGVIAVPMYDWEKHACEGCGFTVNEGPTALYGFPRNKTYIMYSASFCATKYYSIGMLELVGQGSGFPFLWAKHPRPLFQNSPEVFGVGHNSITTSPDYSESWIVYHAKTDPGEGPRDREARIQKFSYFLDGRPDFSRLLPRNSSIPMPSNSPSYVLMCSEPKFRGQMCVGLVPMEEEEKEYTLDALASRGIILTDIRSIQIVGDAALEVYVGKERSLIIDSSVDDVRHPTLFDSATSVVVSLRPNPNPLVASS